MNRNEFVRMIQKYRDRLSIAEFMRILIFALGIGVGVGILFQLLSFVVPFYDVNLYTGAAIVLAVLTALILSCIRRSTMEQAALAMDRFGFQERIVTAYEHLEEEGEMVELQRKDAMKMLMEHKDRIQIKVMPAGKKMIGVVCLFILLLVTVMMPSEMRDRAKELHQIREEAREKEKEIEDVAEEIEKLAQEELTPEQLAALQEMIESMQSSITEYQQAVSAEMLATANQKLNYKYEDMSSLLSGLAAELQSGASVSAVTPESMQAMAEKLQEMSGNPASESQLASNQGQNNGQSGNGQNNSQNEQSGSGQNNGQNGQSGSGQSGQSGNGQNSGQSGQSGNGQNSGQSGQSGNGQGNGNGSGNGNGQGSGSGSGSGTGSGSGRGEGSSNTPHDYVSIPNAIMDSGNLTGNAQNHDNSDFFRTQNGLSWEGTPVSHEAVIGSYEQNAYEGIAAGRYPTGMEDVIKEYFASFN